jgi:Fur family ferric uptake transcriptional regulator
MNHCQHRLSSEEAFERLQSALKAQGARLTSPRKLILECALRAKKPFSAESLQLALKAFTQKSGSKKAATADLATPDLATVYRNLAFFSDIGLISRVDLGGDMAVYEIASKESGHHHHYFICRSCGKTEALESCSMAPIEAQLKKKGFRDLTHRLEFSGLCANC